MSDEYRRMLKKRLGPAKYASATKSYDVVGRIAIIDADKRTAKKIAKTIMELNKNVKTVVRKTGAVKGTYRLRKFEIVAGKHNYMTEYRENNSRFVFDIRKTFFSPRLAYERSRITQLAKDGENVVVMFAGVGPFAIELAKKNKNSKIIAIELNRDAYKYLLENIKLNKAANVIPELGDVKKKAKSHKNFADRIIMPLPRGSYGFLDAALTMSKKACTVHYYTFADMNDKAAPVLRIKEFLKSRKRKATILNTRAVRPYSSQESELVIDLKIS